MNIDGEIVGLGEGIDLSAPAISVVSPVSDAEKVLTSHNLNSWEVKLTALIEPVPWVHLGNEPEKRQKTCFMTVYPMTAPARRRCSPRLLALQWLKRDSRETLDSEHRPLLLKRPWLGERGRIT